MLLPQRKIQVPSTWYENENKTTAHSSKAIVQVYAAARAVVAKEQRAEDKLNISDG